jgi:hypothetical protein
MAVRMATSPSTTKGTSLEALDGCRRVTIEVTTAAANSTNADDAITASSVGTRQMYQFIC